MRNKIGIIVLAVIVTLLSFYYLSFTFIARKEQSKANKLATTSDGKVDLNKKQKYLDSLYDVPVYNFLGIKYTYKEVKETELALGLDLQGGMHVTLEVSPVEILTALAGSNGTDPKFSQALKAAKEKQKSSQKDLTQLFYESYRDIEGNNKLSRIFSNSVNTTKGITSRSTDAEVEKVIDFEVDNAIDRAEEIIRTRIDKFGAVQPNIQRLGESGRIQVELPGVENPQRVRNLLQGAAKLEFLEVYHIYEIAPYLTKANDYLMSVQPVQGTVSNPAVVTDAEKMLQDSTLTNADSTTASARDTTTVAKDTTAAKGSILFTLLKSNGSLRYDIKDTAKINRIFDMPKVKAMFPGNVKFYWDKKGYKGDDGMTTLELVPVKKSRTGEAPLTGDVISDARGDISQDGKTFEVSMQMNPLGAKKWKKMTADASSDARNKRRVAIVLDDNVYSAPTVQVEIPNGNSSITGNFTLEEAKDLANILKAGKLPAPVRIVEEVIVGPTLGKESIRQGLISIGAGFLMIILFMVMVYSTSGWVANLAVLLNLLILLGVLASMNAALTLPGIAGILLSLAIAVDANVLINERVKEDLNEGKRLETAISSGYKNAFSAIIDSNVTTLIKGFVLLIFGTGLIYGFALTLIIGILCSLFTSVLLTRVIFEYLLKKNKKISFSNSWSKNLFRSINIDFIGKRKLYYTISSLVIVAGIISLSIKGFNYGVDFKGGRTYVVKLDKPVQSTDIRKALEIPFGSAPEVKTYGADNKFKITTSYLIDDNTESATTIAEQKLGQGLVSVGGKYEVLSSSIVGPTIANDIKVSAMYSLLIAVALMFLYILIRFKKWQFALGTVVSLIHVVLVVISLYSLLEGILPFSLEVDQSFIAAILTVIGYSINDSVVVFDRVREFLSGNKDQENVPKVINNALNDTLSRTLITGVSTIFVIIILFVFGGETIKGFTFAMLIGVLVGTYSSLCIGTPVLVDFLGKGKLNSDKLLAKKPVATI